MKSPLLHRRAVQPADSSEVAAPPEINTSATNHIVSARNEFAHAFGDLARGKRNWQVMAFCLAGLLGLVTVAYVRLASTARVVPYVVEVDRLGQVAAVGMADQMRTPDDRLIASQLAQFIRAVRTVLPVQASAAENRLVHQGYAFAGPKTAAFLNDYFSIPRNDPRVLGNEATREVDVTSVLHLPNSNVWRLQWTETQRALEPTGPVGRTAWEAYVTVQVVPPTSAEGVQENPLGLYVTSLNWTRVSAPGQSDDEHARPMTPPDSSLQE